MSALNGERILPAAWYRAYTVADIGVIESLDDETRAVVERYRRALLRDSNAEGEGSPDYEQGWDDAMEEVNSAIDGVHMPLRHRQRRRA